MGVDGSIYATWYAVLVSCGIWVLLYFTVKVSLPERDPEFCSRVVTLWHGSFMGVYGLDQCFTGKNVFENPNEPSTDNQAFILVASLGYFLLDLSWCLYYQTETALMIAHHVYSCFALSRMLFKSTGGHVAACGLGCLEITNPLLQARWFTRTFGYHESRIFTVVEITFMLLFVVVRILFGSMYIVYISMHPKISFEFIFLAVVIYIMSWLFMINISRYFYKRYLQQNTHADINIANINSS